MADGYRIPDGRHNLLRIDLNGNHDGCLVAVHCREDDRSNRAGRPLSVEGNRISEPRELNGGRHGKHLGRRRRPRCQIGLDRGEIRPGEEESLWGVETPHGPSFSFDGVELGALQALDHLGPRKREIVANGVLAIGRNGQARDESNHAHGHEHFHHRETSAAHSGKMEGAVVTLSRPLCVSRQKNCFERELS